MGKFEEAVRGVIEGLDEDDDFVETVRDAIPVADLVREIVGSDAKAKVAVRRAVLSVIEDLHEDDDFVDAVREAMDFSEIAEEALKDPQVAKAIGTEATLVIKGDMKNADDFSDAVSKAVMDNFDYAELSANDERFSEAVADLVLSVISGLDRNEDAVSHVLEGISLGERAGKIADESEEVKVALANFVKDTIEGATLEDMFGRDGASEIFSSIGIGEKAGKLLAEDKTLAEAINTAIATAVTEKVRDLATDEDIGSAIDAAIADSETVKAAIDRAVSSLSLTGTLDAILQSAVERIITNNREIARIVCDKVASDLATKISEVLSRAGLTK